jgi:hypothetical protein
MAEIKNNFLGSKMNRDVDDRLIPANEYRYALNLEINKSSDSNVGTLQNAQGNELVVDFNQIEQITTDPLLQCIGSFVDNTTDRIYIFLTNYTNPGFSPQYSPTAKNFIYVRDIKAGTTTKLIEGAWLNFSTTNPVYGINVIEDLLFWTDNRNQPRKINVSKAINTAGYYTTEDQISVAKVSPLHPFNLYKRRASDATIAPNQYETSMYDVSSELYPNNAANPYWQNGYEGDPKYLESKMVRFSYRYKFEDGEYSIFAPFTQVAYIPKQDGFFMTGDEEDAYRSTIVRFMQNKVNNILLQMILPGAANTLASAYKISEVEIIYKESDSPVVSVVDSIPVSKIASASGSSTTYEYEYQSKKPFKTLPERDIIRVYDRVPLKALGQEIISNRVVYSNFQDKASYPKYLNYNVGYSEKFPFGFNSMQGSSIIEYPNHTLKQNRNYQIGVILGDKYGRQSGVILSDKITSNIADFGASSLYVPYLSQDYNIKNWPGFSLKVLFNDPIPSNGPDVNTGWPGLYNGDPNSPNYNPTGWYSYKIVVKQTEQDYYNVYLPGVMAAYPGDPTKELSKTAHAVLINDNINKVPRDLKEVGPTQTQFRSSVTLYNRVNNTDGSNAQAFPGNKYAFVSTIATNSSLFNVDPGALPPNYDEFYQIESNPLIARISTELQLGVVSTGDVQNLAIYETKPVESKLDIYWETSTVGLISELNNAILTDSGGAAIVIGWTFNMSEANSIGTTVVNNFGFTDLSGVPVFPTSMPVMEVRNLNNDIRTSKFQIQAGSSPGTYKIVTNDYFYYGLNAAQLETYVFYFTVQANGVQTILNKQGGLTNIAPDITNTDTLVEYSQAVTDVYQFNAVNGSNALGGKSTNDLVWTIVSQEAEQSGNWFNTTIFSIVNSPATPSGMLRDTGLQAVGLYRVTVRVTDAGGATDTYTIMLSYTPAFTYNCVPLDGGCQVVPNQSGTYATLAECQGACITCRSYSLTCSAAPGLQCEARYYSCITNQLSLIQFTSGSSATITCARTGSAYSTAGNVTFTPGNFCYS